MKFKPGDHVLITAGEYKKYGGGVYKGIAGTTMAYVKVIGDNREQRRLQLKSIEKQTNSNSSNRRGEDTVTINIAEYESLLDQLDSLEDTIDEMRQKMKELII